MRPEVNFYVYDRPVTDTNVVASFCVAWIVYTVLVKTEQKCLQCFDAVGWTAGRASGL